MSARISITLTAPQARLALAALQAFDPQDLPTSEIDSSTPALREARHKSTTEKVESALAVLDRRADRKINQSTTEPKDTP